MIVLILYQILAYKLHIPLPEGGIKITKGIKTMKEDPKNLERRKEAARRLAIIAGQINAVKAMIENGRDCLDIAIQSSAVLNALRGVNKIILRNLMDDCHNTKRTIEEANDEVIDVLYKFIK